jgi:hypothetical protein
MQDSSNKNLLVSKINFSSVRIGRNDIPSKIGRPKKILRSYNRRINLSHHHSTPQPPDQLFQPLQLQQAFKFVNVRMPKGRSSGEKLARSLKNTRQQLLSSKRENIALAKASSSQKDEATPEEMKTFLVECGYNLLDDEGNIFSPPGIKRLYSQTKAQLHVKTA